MVGKRLLGFPKQIAYIIGNEACERFSYYGMRSILVIFMTQYLLMQEHQSKAVYHFFMSANYFMPLLGGWLSDRYLGKYNTILWLSLVYCVGHGVLAAFESTTGLYWGLGLIALGSGGIKPCVSAFVGDQLGKTDKHLVSKVYDLFYFSVNFGAFFSSILIPWTLPKYGPSVAFGIPGVLMAVATLVFWMGRRHYVVVPPTGTKDQTHFFSILWYALTHLGQRKGKQHWLDTALAKYDAKRVEGVKAVVAVGAVFSSATAFWALYDQSGSSWVLQAQKMNLNFMGVQWEASQIQALNPIMILVLIPVFSLWLYPLAEKVGLRPTPLRRLGTGMFLTGLSFAMVGIIEVFLNKGVFLSVGWQILPYLVLGAAEVMVSITGLEFAYTQAPKTMKGTIMSLWLLTISAGNFFTGVVSQLNPFTSGAAEFFFYGGLVFVVSFLFVAIAVRYKERSYVGE